MNYQEYVWIIYYGEEGQDSEGEGTDSVITEIIEKYEKFQDTFPNSIASWLFKMSIC